MMTDATENAAGDSREAQVAIAEGKLQKAVDKALYFGGNPAAQKVRNFLNGTWLGQPLQIILTDIPIGAWTVALVFDALEAASDRPEFAVAADASVAIGLAGAASAAATANNRIESPFCRPADDADITAADRAPRGATVVDISSLSYLLSRRATSRHGDVRSQHEGARLGPRG